MAKKIILSACSIAQDEQGRVVGLGAVMPTREFSVHIYQTPPLPGRYWSRYPISWERLQQNPLLIAAALQNYRTWLQTWPGNHVVCMRGAEFWRLSEEFKKHLGGVPFGENLLDYQTLNVDKTRDIDEFKKYPHRGELPIEIAREIWKQVQAMRFVDQQKPQVKQRIAKGVVPAPTPLRNNRYDPTTYIAWSNRKS